jgi:hypothetical protein
VYEVVCCCWVMGNWDRFTWGEVGGRLIESEIISKRSIRSLGVCERGVWGK